MSNRGYSSSAGGYGAQNYYMRPSYQNGGYDQDQRYYAQGGGGGGGRPYDRPERPERPEYYDRNNGNGYGGGYGGGYNGGYAGSSGSGYGGYGAHRGGGNTAYGDEISFRPWDQTYRYVIFFF